MVLTFKTAFQGLDVVCRGAGGVVGVLMCVWVSESQQMK